jgi:hypothetical protein
MIDAGKLAEALEIQRASFALLKWVRVAIDQGLIKLDTAHIYMTEADAAAEWIGKHYANLPADCRPATREPEPIRRFSNFFASYLLTSYELNEKPRSTLTSACGCYCPFCTYVGSGPFLRPRKIGLAEKRKAAKLQQTHLEELCARLRIAPTSALLTRILRDATLAEQAALGAYGVQLLRRCEGLRVGPEALALWRAFAWNRAGSPKRKYRLTMEAIRGADTMLAEALRSQGGACGRTANAPDERRGP